MSEYSTRIASQSTSKVQQVYSIVHKERDFPSVHEISLHQSESLFHHVLNTNILLNPATGLLLKVIITAIFFIVKSENVKTLGMKGVLYEIYNLRI